MLAEFGLCMADGRGRYFPSASHRSTCGAFGTDACTVTRASDALIAAVTCVRDCLHIACSIGMAESSPITLSKLLLMTPGLPSFSGSKR